MWVFDEMWKFSRIHFYYKSISFRKQIFGPKIQFWALIELLHLNRKLSFVFLNLIETKIWRQKNADGSTRTVAFNCIRSPVIVIWSEWFSSFFHPTYDWPNSISHSIIAFAFTFDTNSFRNFEIQRDHSYAKFRSFYWPHATPRRRSTSLCRTPFSMSPHNCRPT